MVQTIDLGLVKGADGATGPQGPQGETGATGATGPQGPAGRGLPTGETQHQMPIRGASDIEWQDPLVIKNRLGIASITTATDIDTGESLDNIRTVGTYNCETDLIAASLVNSPTAKAFVLVVSYATGTNAMLLQTVIEAESGKRYTRAYTAGTGAWGAWAYDLSVTAATPVLPLGNGGTGQTTAAGLRNALGLGNTLDQLAIANGGTGANTAAGARNALGLGNTTGALPIANGGTGAATAAEALAALGGLGKEIINIPQSDFIGSVSGNITINNCDVYVIGKRLLYLDVIMTCASALSVGGNKELFKVSTVGFLPYLNSTGICYFGSVAMWSNINRYFELDVVTAMAAGTTFRICGNYPLYSEYTG